MDADEIKHGSALRWPEAVGSRRDEHQAAASCTSCMVTTLQALQCCKHKVMCAKYKVVCAKHSPEQNLAKIGDILTLMGRLWQRHCSQTRSGFGEGLSGFCCREGWDSAATQACRRLLLCCARHGLCIKAQSLRNRAC